MRRRCFAGRSGVGVCGLLCSLWIACGQAPEWSDDDARGGEGGEGEDDRVGGAGGGERASGGAGASEATAGTGGESEGGYGLFSGSAEPAAPSWLDLTPESDPDVDEPDAAGDEAASGVPDMTLMETKLEGPVGSFAAVKGIFGQHCASAGCHDGSHPAAVDLRPNEGLYDRIVNKKPTIGPEGCRKWLLINPGNHDANLITLKIDPDSAFAQGVDVRRDCGARMPKGCGEPGGPRCLNAIEIGAMWTWNDIGAPRQ